MYEKIKEILVSELGLTSEEITPDAKIRSKLGISSVEFVDIAMTIEEEFDVELDEDKLRKIKTVQDLVDYVEALKK